MTDAVTTGPRRAAARRFDPLRPLWRLLTSVRFAVWLIAFLAVAGLLGVLIPQIPIAMRGDPTAVAEWVRFQQGKFGPFTDMIDRLGLFNVFGARWFQAGLALLALAVGVCVANRFPPIWRTIHQPQKRVAEGYLRRARHHAEFATPADPAALERVLRHHRYRVERFEQNEAVYLFADRYQWAQLGTFASHLALIIFLLAALVSMGTGYETQLFIAEGRGAPVFPVQHPDQMQVYVEDTVGRFDDQGRPLDYRSYLVIYQGGQEVRRCVTTVNDPCTYHGYRFSQAAYYGFGAELQVRDLANGRVMFKEVLELSDTMPAPRVVVRDQDGRVLVDETLVLRTVLEGAYLTRRVVPPAERAFVIGLRRDEERHRWMLLAFESGEAGAASATRVSLAPGEEAVAAGLRVRFAGLSSLPAVVRRDIPVGRPSGTNQPASPPPLLLQLGNTVYGSGEASSGRPLAAPVRDGPPTLSISGLGAQVATLRPGESTSVNGYEYTFLDRREFAGIQVKRDRGAPLIWLAVALLVGGLVITFHVPRRRLWAKVAAGRTSMAGIAGPLVDFGRELHRLGAEAGAPDTLADEGNER